mmetsp:Transcript_20835/g.34361  ORF Transcript_20835/g.34361 Transcript_20835/m.34361 type:complete len:732 (-) Transcript_20835:178-2373(-)
MPGSTPSRIAAAKNAGAAKNAINAKEQSTDDLSPSEKRRQAALKGWERKREQEKSAVASRKMRIAPSRSARSTTKTAPAVPAPQQQKSKVVKAAASAQKKGWETRKKKMAAAAAAAAAASPASSSSTKPKSLTHSEAAKLGWERIRAKKAMEEAKAKAAAASKKKSSTKTKGLSRAEAAKLGWERIRAKKMLEAEAESAPAKEDAEEFKARSKSSKKGWETRKKKMLGQVKVQEKAKDKIFAVRSKSSLKGWETRRKMAGIEPKVEVEDTDEWQQRSKASKKGWETRRKLANQEAAGAGGNAKSLIHSEAAKLGWERKRKMQDMLDDSSESADETPRKKPYTAAARSKAAKMAWQKAREKKMLLANTATAPSGRAYYQQDASVATYTYTAERVEWEIRQKMLAAANEDEDSSSEGQSDEESSEEEDSSDEGEEENEVVEEKTEERAVADISRDEAANLLLAMFGNSAPVAPAAKAEDTSVAETSQEASIAEALQDLKGAKSEDTSLSFEIYGNEVKEEGMEDQSEVEETSMRGRKRKPTYKHMMQHEEEIMLSAKAPSAKSSSVKVSNAKAKAFSAKTTPKSPTRSGATRVASKSATVVTKGKTSKQRSTTAKQGWQKRKNDVFKKSKFDPKENEQISKAIEAVEMLERQAAGKEMALPRGVTVRPSGKWQAQLYYAGKSRYIGVFESREDACYAYEVARQVLMSCKEPKDDEVDANINLARKAAFAGVRQ